MDVVVSCAHEEFLLCHESAIPVGRGKYGRFSYFYEFLPLIPPTLRSMNSFYSAGLRSIRA